MYVHGQVDSNPPSLGVMWLRSDDFADGEAIPTNRAFGEHDPDTHIRLAENSNPHLEWGDVPDGARSLVLTLVDLDAPLDKSDANKEEVALDETTPRGDFTHWVLIDIDPDQTGVDPAEFCIGVTARGKRGLDGRPREGVNDYTSWFEGDPDMEGVYKGYDGPCPPFNDAVVHRYRFDLYALDITEVPVSGDFSVADVRSAIDGHILDRVSLTATYTLNPALGLS